jgi:hypothetical protein
VVGVGPAGVRDDIGLVDGVIDGRMVTDGCGVDVGWGVIEGWAVGDEVMITLPPPEP